MNEKKNMKKFFGEPYSLYKNVFAVGKHSGCGLENELAEKYFFFTAKEDLSAHHKCSDAWKSMFCA